MCSRSAVVSYTRLGLALQLVMLRFLGTFLPDPTEVPAAVERNDSKKCFIEN